MAISIVTQRYANDSELLLIHRDGQSRAFTVSEVCERGHPMRNLGGKTPIEVPTITALAETELRLRTSVLGSPVRWTLHIAGFTTPDWKILSERVDFSDGTAQAGIPAELDWGSDDLPVE